MSIASVADVKAKFSGYLKASEEGPIVVTKNGKPVAMLVSVLTYSKRSMYDVD
jgi:prevent-host-death family protein